MRTTCYIALLVFFILNFNMENKSFAQSSKETWEKFEFKGFKGKVENILFSKDGSLVYGLGANHSLFDGGKTLKAWNVSDGKEKFVIKNINSYVLSRDSKMMITWGGAETEDIPSDNNVIIWDAIEGIQLFNLGKHRISNIEFSSNCKKVIGNTIGGDFFSRVAKFKIWDLTKNGEELKSLDGTGIFDGNGKNIVFFDNESDSINILDSITLEPVPAPKRIHSGKELLLTKSFDGKKVVSVSVEKNNQSLLKVWDFSKNKDLVDEEKELFEFEEKHKVSSVIFSPDGEKLLTRCYQKKAGKSQKETPLSIWNVGTGKKIISLLDDNNNQNQLTTIAFSIGDKIGISREGIDDNNSDIRYVNQQATLNIIDLSINKEIKIFAYKTNDKGSIGFNNSSVPIVFSPDGKIIASAHCIVHNGKIKENENPIELWDTEKGEKIFSFDGHGKVLPVGLDGGRRIIPQEADTAVSALAFNHDGTMLASGSRDGSIKLWEISPKKNNSDSKDSVSSPTETRQDPTGLTPSTRNEQFTFNKQDPSKQSTTEIKPPVKEPIPPDDINEYYGVVAISQNTGRYGFCFAHHKDKQEAANHALSFCNARDAKVVLCVKNQWFALASGGGGAFGWAHGSDPDKVRERAINECLRFSNTAQIVVLDHSNNKNHLNQSLKSTSTNPGWDKSDVSSDIKKDYDKILNSHHKGFISELKNTFAEFPDIRILVWKNAAEIGNTHAMVLYAKHLEYAQTPDLEKSLNYMKKAAQNEDAFAMTELAYFYIYGKGIPKNIDEGIQWLRKASELEDPQAMSSLAYYFRDKYKDSENSFFWAKKGSNLGNTNAIIQLAHCYYHGFGVDKNEAECFRLYLKAADLGNSLSVNNVGVCYAKGIGVDKDDKKSFEMYLKSAELGLLSGMYNVANCYKNGKGTSEDREKAIEWYKKSAKYGEERSRKTLKEMGIDY